MELKDMVNQRLDAIQSRLKEIYQECNRVRQMVAVVTEGDTQLSLVIPPPPAAEPPKVQTPVVPPPVVLPPVTVVPPVTEPQKQPESETPVVIPPPQVQKPKAETPPVTVTPPAPKQENKKENENRTAVTQPVKMTVPADDRKPTDWEKFIGENLLNKIGIGVLILGIGIFVKYAIDHDWIGPLGRVLIGVLCGGLLLGIAHKLRKTYQAFSSVLVGGGIAVLYFTAAIAYHEYHLITQPVAFAFMCLITVGAVGFSLAYNRQELAIIALLGGFAAPFLVSNGSGNYQVLFVYLLILNVGMVALAAFRNWKIIHLLSFAGTLLLFGGWVVMRSAEGTLPVGDSMLFGSLFFVVLLALHSVYYLRTRTAPDGFDYIMVSVNLLFYFLVMMNAMEKGHLEDWRGLFAGIMGIFHLGAAWLISKVDRERHLQLFKMLFIGTGIGFLALFVPFQFDGKAIPLFWAAQAIILTFIFMRSGMQLLWLAGQGLMALSLLSLVLYWTQYYGAGLPLNSLAFFNPAFLTGALITAALLIQHFVHKMKSAHGDEMRSFSDAYKYAFWVLFYVASVVEMVARVKVLEGPVGFELIPVIGFSAFLVMGWRLHAMATGNTKAEQLHTILSLIFLFGAITAGTGTLISVKTQVELGGFSVLFTKFHLVVWGSIVAVAGLNFLHHRSSGMLNQEKGFVFNWVWPLAMVFGLSVGMLFVLPHTGMREETVVRVGFTILWGTAGFAMIVLGLKEKLLHLRLAALTLLGITLVKLFAWDIAEAPTGGKIIAFISLGVLLLVISFLYQRLKRLLIDGEINQEKE